MGSILVNIPDISDSDLVFTEDETRQILKFFWPHMTDEIGKMTIDNAARRLAQTALIAAIESSYAMGFIQALGEVVVRPGSGVKSFAAKLARKFVKHWWRHTTQRDLENVRIYDSIRNTIALRLRGRLEMVQRGASLRRGSIPFYAVVEQSAIVWA